MTTFRQPEYEALIEAIRNQEQKENPDFLKRPKSSEVRVSCNMAFPRDMLTDRELECVTAVFRSFETGLRGATIYPSDLHGAMKMLGLNPTEQEVVDIPNNIAKKGLIYFPDFCQLILKWFRSTEAEEESFRQNMFKILCGTEPFPTDFRAKKYKLDKHSISKAEFVHLMKSLPVCVEDADIEEMFQFADQDGDGKLSYQEFQVMINPPAPPEQPKPHISDLGMPEQVFSPDAQDESNFASPLLSRPGSLYSRSTPHSSMVKLSSRCTSIAGSTVNISHL